MSKGESQSVKPPRWERAYLDDELMKCKQMAKINKIWACGPPLMDEQFDKILLDVAGKYDVDFRTQIDIM